MIHALSENDEAIRQDGTTKIAFCIHEESRSLGSRAEVPPKPGKGGLPGNRVSLLRTALAKRRLQSGDRTGDAVRDARNFLL